MADCDRCGLLLDSCAGLSATGIVFDLIIMGLYLGAFLSAKVLLLTGVLSPKGWLAMYVVVTPDLVPSSALSRLSLGWSSFFLPNRTPNSFFR